MDVHTGPIGRISHGTVSVGTQKYSARAQCSSWLQPNRRPGVLQRRRRRRRTLQRGAASPAPRAFPDSRRARFRCWSTSWQARLEYDRGAALRGLALRGLAKALPAGDPGAASSEPRLHHGFMLHYHLGIWQTAYNHPLIINGTGANKSSPRYCIHDATHDCAARSCLSAGRCAWQPGATATHR